MTTLDTTDTIAAVGSPPQGGWQGLVRVTGPAALSIALRGLEPPRGCPTDHPVRAERWSGRLRVEGLRRPLLVELNVWPGSKTYTGQPLVEVQTKGSAPILGRVLASFLEQGARLAEPGEFTLRAFLAGRLDLTQSEAVLGVIDAQSAQQLDAALEQLAGGLAGPLRELRNVLTDTLAHLEANLDFADEADVDPLGRAELARVLDEQAGQVADLARRLGGRDRANRRPQVVLIGPPNVGKSRLLNALTGQDHAIVADVAGTTRDYLAVECDCDGVAVDLVDTAGEEAALTAIGQEAQAGRTRQARAADLILDCSADGRDVLNTSEGDAPPRILVRTKADLAEPASPTSGPKHPEVVTSGLSSAGVRALRSAIAAHFRSGGGRGTAESLASTSGRSSEGLAASSRALASAAEAVRLGAGDELVAVDLRQAVDELGRIVGAVVTDDLLDRIFRRFCIGK